MKYGRIWLINSLHQSNNGIIKWQCEKFICISSLELYMRESKKYNKCWSKAEDAANGIFFPHFFIQYEVCVK